MKIGLYSVTYSGAWYRARALALSEFVARARQFGFMGVELALKRPHGSPLDLDEKACQEVREELNRQGVELAACASYSDFSSPIVEHREVQLHFLRSQVQLARDLGAKVLRVFAAWPGITLRDGVATYDMTRRYVETHYPDTTYLERWSFVKEGLREAAGYAEKAGVVLALQNHAPIIRTYEDMLAFIREVDSPFLKACLDCPLLRPHDGDAEYVAQAVRDTGALQVHSHFGGEFSRTEDGCVRLNGGTNYPAFVRALKEIGYDGYLCYEFCHPCLDEKHQVAGIERVDEQVRLAAEYMSRVIAGA